MKKLLALLVLVSILSSAKASNDSSYLQKAEATAIAEHKFILLNFSGSDWCVPCIKMKKTIFEADSFKHYAAEKLVWMNADFPRVKKNLSKAQAKENEKLAEKYNGKGAFPYTVLLDGKGNVIKSWDGFVNASPEEFIKQIAIAINDRRKADNTDAAQTSVKADGKSL
jgi:thioredoxin-related protein